MADELRGLRILVIDDNDDGRELLEIFLRMAGASVRSASTVGHALALYDAEPPDAIVSDLNMPVSDGYDLARALRARDTERGRHTVAVAVTGGTLLYEPEHSFAAGFNAQLVRPFEPSAIVSKLRELAGP